MTDLALAGRLEYATEADPALSYCLWDYPRPAPAEDKFRSVNLLFQSFAQGGIGNEGFDLVDGLREAIGPFRTVFGVKWRDGRLGWEFYFYDYRRLQRQVSIARVLAATRRWLRCEIAANENLPYFMFSLDFDAEIAKGSRAVDVVHMYIGNPGSAVSSGIAYAVQADATRLENFYFFFDAATQHDEIIKKLCCSPYFDASAGDLDEILMPQLRNCRTICVANKQTHDCIYFSGVDVTQLLFFLRRLGYPAETIDFVAANRMALDHLLFDVGFDYRLDGAAVRVLKSGYYGVF
jgi:hypothetical protein